MKKILSSSILASILVAPGFSAFPGSDMNNDGQLENGEISSNMRQGQFVRPKKNQASNEQNNDANLEKQHIGGKRSQDMTARSEHPFKTKKSKKIKHSNQRSKDKESEDDNPNLANLTTPEHVNIRDNLAISDEDRSLNRQMMLNGPQGGFQNTQPRGIGGTRANY